MQKTPPRAASPSQASNISFKDHNEWLKQIPQKFSFWLEALARQVVKQKPEHIAEFACMYFEDQLELRAVELSNIPQRSYFHILRDRRRNEIEPTAVELCRRPVLLDIPDDNHHINQALDPTDRADTQSHIPHLTRRDTMACPSFKKNKNPVFKREKSAPQLLLHLFPHTSDPGLNMGDLQSEVGTNTPWAVKVIGVRDNFEFDGIDYVELLNDTNYNAVMPSALGESTPDIDSLGEIKIEKDGSLSFISTPVSNVVISSDEPGPKLDTDTVDTSLPSASVTDESDTATSSKTDVLPDEISPIKTEVVTDKTSPPKIPDKASHHSADKPCPPKSDKANSSKTTPPKSDKSSPKTSPPKSDTVKDSPPYKDPNKSNTVKNKSKRPPSPRISTSHKENASYNDKSSNKSTTSHSSKAKTTNKCNPKTTPLKDSRSTDTGAPAYNSSRSKITPSPKGGRSNTKDGPTTSNMSKPKDSPKDVPKGKGPPPHKGGAYSGGSYAREPPKTAPKPKGIPARKESASSSNVNAAKDTRTSHATKESQSSSSVPFTGGPPASTQQHTPSSNNAHQNVRDVPSNNAPQANNLHHSTGLPFNTPPHVAPYTRGQSSTNAPFPNTAPPSHNIAPSNNRPNNTSFDNNSTYAKENAYYNNNLPEQHPDTQAPNDAYIGYCLNSTTPAFIPSNYLPSFDMTNRNLYHDKNNPKVKPVDLVGSTIDLARKWIGSGSSDLIRERCSVLNDFLQIQLISDSNKPGAGDSSSFINEQSYKQNDILLCMPNDVDSSTYPKYGSMNDHVSDSEYYNYPEIYQDKLQYYSLAGSGNHVLRNASESVSETELVNPNEDSPKPKWEPHRRTIRVRIDTREFGVPKLETIVEENEQKYDTKRETANRGTNCQYHEFELYNDESRSTERSENFIQQLRPVYLHKDEYIRAVSRNIPGIDSGKKPEKSKNADVKMVEEAISYTLPWGSCWSKANQTVPDVSISESDSSIEGSYDFTSAENSQTDLENSQSFEDTREMKYSLSEITQTSSPMESFQVSQTKIAQNKNFLTVPELTNTSENISDMKKIIKDAIKFGEFDISECDITNEPNSSQLDVTDAVKDLAEISEILVDDIVKDSSVNMKSLTCLEESVDISDNDNEISVSLDISGDDVSCDFEFTFDESQVPCNSLEDEESMADMNQGFVEDAGIDVGSDTSQNDLMKSESFTEKLGLVVDDIVKDIFDNVFKELNSDINKSKDNSYIARRDNLQNICSDILDNIQTYIECAKINPVKNTKYHFLDKRLSQAFNCMGNIIGPESSDVRKTSADTLMSNDVRQNFDNINLNWKEANNSETVTYAVENLPNLSTCQYTDDIEVDLACETVLDNISNVVVNCANETCDMISDIKSDVTTTIEASYPNISNAAVTCTNETYDAILQIKSNDDRTNIEFPTETNNIHDQPSGTKPHNYVNISNVAISCTNETSDIIEPDVSSSLEASYTTNLESPIKSETAPYSETATMELDDTSFKPDVVNLDIPPEGTICDVTKLDLDDSDTISIDLGKLEITDYNSLCNSIELIDIDITLDAPDSDVSPSVEPVTESVQIVKSDGESLELESESITKLVGNDVTTDCGLVLDDIACCVEGTFETETKIVQKMDDEMKIDDRKIVNITIENVDTKIDDADMKNTEQKPMDREITNTQSKIEDVSKESGEAITTPEVPTDSDDDSERDIVKCDSDCELDSSDEQISFYEVESFRNEAKNGRYSDFARSDSDSEYNINGSINACVEIDDIGETILDEYEFVEKCKEYSESDRGLTFTPVEDYWCAGIHVIVEFVE